MRMQSSPRPASARRVVAGKRTRPDETKNCVRKLLKREISRAGNLAFTRTNSQEKFRNFHLQEEFDTHDPKAHHFLKLPFLKKRSRIVEIGAARDTVFALTHSGICAAFSRGAALIPNCFITNLMGHIVVDCFSDLRAGFECTRHKQENMFPQHQCR
jgi:hypothetical protein